MTQKLIREQNGKNAQHGGIQCQASPEGKADDVAALLHEACSPRIDVAHLRIHVSFLLTDGHCVHFAPVC